MSAAIDNGFGAPFNEIFDDEEHAEWAFDLMLDTLDHLSIYEDDDQRFAVILVERDGGQNLHLYYGKRLILGFRNRKAATKRVSLVFFDDDVPIEDCVREREYNARLVGGRHIGGYGLVLEDAMPFSAEVERAFHAALDAIVTYSAGLNRSPRRADQELQTDAIAQAIFDPLLRPDLLRDGVIIAKGLPQFITAAREFDREELSAEIAIAEEQRREVLHRFSLEDWPEMALERYALGQEDKDNYCYWLEFRTTQLGSMRGGSSTKHIIFKRQKTTGWYFPKKYSDVHTAWETVRSAFVQMFEFVRSGEWRRITELEAISGARVLRTKSLHMYFPTDVLPVTSADHLKYFLTKLGAYRHEMRHWDPVLLNRELLRVLRSKPDLEEWTTNELGKFLYIWSDPRESGRIVKITPGDGALYWDDCLDNGYICMRWDETDDLTAYDNLAEFSEYFNLIGEESYSYDSAGSAKIAKQLWTLRELEPGDIVVAAKGASEILAVGTVVDPGYEWLAARSEAKHAVHVKWDTTYARPMTLPTGWNAVILAEVSSDLYRKIISLPTTEKQRESLSTPTPPPVKPPEEYKRMSDALERKRQVILYGPPGTGKTYHARGFAVWWLLKQQDDPRRYDVIGDPASLRQIESELTDVADGSLTWITFHPSYSYEDFVEGFRPVESADSGLVLKMEDGLFKRICREAQVNPDKRYLILIDEINRANLAKVFGELITLLEKDKRGLTITLPQSKESFSVPDNVFLLGTMNTADRSIKLMDTALRRRFAFIELMPDVAPLAGAAVNDLALDDFLLALNARVARNEGREKQLGHALLMDDGEAIADAAEFARRFRQEILPLLQEYCYDNYDDLADYIGRDLVDPDAGQLKADVLDDDDALIAALVTLTASEHATD